MLEDTTQLGAMSLEWLADTTNIPNPADGLEP